MAGIERDFWVDDLARAEDEVGALGAVLVQSANSRQETLDLLALHDDPRVLGIVGWVDLTGDVETQIRRLRDAPGGDQLVGVRHLVHQDQDSGWLARDAVGVGLEALAAAGLPFDLVLNAEQLTLAADTVAAHPGVRFVLDHLAKPDLVTGDLRRWSQDLRRIAALPNVVAKVSGLTMAADWDAWTVDELRPAIDLALDAFGPDRIMFGSDWPLVTLCRGYGAWLAAARVAFEHLAPVDRDRVLAGTAIDTYQLRVDA